MNEKQSKNNVKFVNEYDMYLHDEAKEMEEIANELLYDEYIKMEEDYYDMLYKEFAKKYGFDAEIEDSKDSVFPVEWIEIRNEETNSDEVKNNDENTENS